jgi:hypothetical protein
MDRENKTSAFPKIRGLEDLDGINDQFQNLLSYLDRDEEQLGVNTEFPSEDCNALGSLIWEELLLFDHDTIQEFIWKTGEIIRRIDIQSNRIERILSWIDSKIAKSLAMMPDNLFNFVEKDVKIQKMALNYSVVKFLLDEKNDYEQQKLQWRNLSKNLEKKERSFWFRLTKIDKEK